MHFVNKTWPFTVKQSLVCKAYLVEVILRCFCKTILGFGWFWSMVKSWMVLFRPKSAVSTCHWFWHPNDHDKLMSSCHWVYGFVWKCCVPRKTQWFSWSLSLWKMAISLGILTQHYYPNYIPNINHYYWFSWSLTQHFQTYPYDRIAPSSSNAHNLPT